MNGIDIRRARHALTAAVVLACGSAHGASLTIFHNNDGESKLFGDASFGGASYFVATLEALRVAQAGRDQLTISSGDNFLAGAAFNASLASGPLGARTYYDALALNEIRYDAITIGNHEFDFGPAVLADFISYYNAQGGTAPFLSANLDFNGEANLQALKAGGKIAASTVVTRGAEQYGIIGVTTTDLPIVSSPGNVVVNPVLAAIQAEVENLQSAGVNKIILSSHLQNLVNETALVPQLRGIDVIIAGGGDELLINADNARNVVGQAKGPYPIIVQDADGRNVAIVTTVGEYQYVGNLQVEFDEFGDVINIAGEPVVVQKSAVTPDATVEANVIAPLNAALATANTTIIATTDVFLEHSEGGTNGPRVIRTRETNLGNLIADAFVWAVQQEATGLNPGNALLGLTNGGGIREDLDDDQDGNISQGEAIATLPFTNTMAVVGNVDVAMLVAALENSVFSLPDENGRFAQISGFQFDYNPGAAAGSRVVAIRLADGTPIWSRGAGALYSGLFDLATNNFTALGGDAYDFGSSLVSILSTGYADALIGYLGSPLGLNGIVSALEYPLTGLGRINAVPVPAAVWLLASALTGLAGINGRRPAPARLLRRL